MKRSSLMLCIATLSAGQVLQAQAGRLQASIHAGIDAGGRRLLGGQVGARILPFATVTLSGSNVGTTGHGLWYWEGSVHFIPWNWKVRPYVLGGAAFARETAAGQVLDSRWGVSLGGGIEVGTGFLRPFAEARVVRHGTVFSNLRGGTDGWFWAGLRLHLFRQQPTPARAPLNLHNTCL